MKEVTKYIAEDGKLFDTPRGCREYEKLCEDLESIMKLLFPTPRDEHCRFANGEGYIQQNEEAVNKCMLEIVKLVPALRAYNPSTFKEDPFKCRHGIIGRILSDMSSPAYHYWCRFMNMDEDYREFGQCYYALHPEKAVLTCLNKV
jgi:hypothetical protein